MKWEHRVVKLDGENPEALTARLDGIGRAGWELVQVLSIQVADDSGTLCASPDLAIFKRPVEAT